VLQLRLLIGGFVDGGDVLKLACLDGKYCGLAGRFPWRHLPLAGWDQASRSLPDSWPRRTTRQPTVTHLPALCGFFFQQRFHHVPLSPKTSSREGRGSRLAGRVPRWRKTPSWRAQHGLLIVPFNRGVGWQRAAAGSPHPRLHSSLCISPAAFLTFFLSSLFFPLSDGAVWWLPGWITDRNALG